MEKEQTNLEYTIDDRDAYGKDIDHIKEKNMSKKWNVLAPTDIVAFTVRFKNPSFLTRIQAKGNDTQVMELVFKDLDRDSVHTFTTSEFKNTLTKNLEINQLVATVDVTLKSIDGKSKKLGLNYLLFKGSTDLANPTKVKPNNFTSEQTIKLDRLNPPNRSKPIGTSQPYRFLAQNNKTYGTFENRQKRILKPKIEQKKVQSKQNNEVNIDDYGKQDSETIIIAPAERDYNVMTLQNLMPCLMHVNEEWIEAQRKMQDELGVPEEERLSNYIRAIQIQKG